MTQCLSYLQRLKVLHFSRGRSPYKHLKSQNFLNNAPRTGLATLCLVPGELGGLG